jgi:hypothetical protein
MNIKLLQLWDLVQSAALWVFKVTLRAVKVLVEETIDLLQKLDTLLTK